MDLEELTPSQEQLLELMSDISEKGYCAGWMTNLEYDLWSAIELGYREYGFLSLDDEVEQLRSLSSESGGWFYFDDGAPTPIKFISLENWKKKYDDFVRGGGCSYIFPSSKSS